KAHPDFRVRLAEASTAAPLHPPLSRALLEAWAMTSLDEHTGRPEAAPWIRGWPDEAEEPKTTMVWRRHLPVTDRGEMVARLDLEAYRAAADPHLSERLDTETRRVLTWLDHRIKSLQPLSDEDLGSAPMNRPLRDKDVIA